MASNREYAWFGSLIRNRRKNMGLTLQELADACGCTKAYLSTIETGRSAPPGPEILKALESKLGYATGELVRFAQATQASESVAWMVNKALNQIRDKKAPSETGNERGDSVNLDHLLHQITPGNRSESTGDRPEESSIDLETGGFEKRENHRLEACATRSSEQNENHRLEACAARPNIQPVREPLVRIPLLNDVTAGRYPNLQTDLDYPVGIADRYVELPGIADPNAFACTVLGESMLPRYLPGDIVIFAPNEQVLSGDDCFVRLANTETTFKRVIDLGEGQLRLLPLNPAYQSWDVNREEVTGLWRAVRRIEYVGREGTAARNRV